MQVLNLYIDINSPGANSNLLNGTSNVLLATRPNWVSGDKFYLRLWFRTKGSLGGTSSSYTLQTGSAIVVAGKSDLTATDALFSATGFTQQTSGSDVYYEALLDLNTAQLATALTSVGSVSVYLDIEVQNSDNSRRLTWRNAITITKQAYAGTEGTTLGNPPYPASSEVAVNTPAGGLQKCISGVWHLKNVTTGLWHPYWLEGNPPQLTFGAGVES